MNNLMEAGGGVKILATTLTAEQVNVGVNIPCHFGRHGKLLIESEGTGTISCEGKIYDMQKPFTNGVVDLASPTEVTWEQAIATVILSGTNVTHPVKVLIERW